MKQYTGQPISLSFDPHTTKPLDVRMVINTASDRLLPSTWLKDSNYYVYPGMPTVCADTGSIYVYIGKENDETDIANSECWVRAGTGGGSISPDVLSEYATKSLVTQTLLQYAESSVLDDYVLTETLESTYAKSEDIPQVDTALSEVSPNPVENRVVTEAINDNIGNIATLRTTLEAILSSEFGDISQWSVSLKEESEMERLTSANTTSGILYFGLEPLDGDEPSVPDTPTTDRVTLTGNTVSVSTGVTYANNTVTTTNTTYSNNNVTLN